MNHEDRIVKFPYAITPVKNGGAGGPALLPLGDYFCGICMVRTNKRHVELSQCDISEIADKIFGSIESKMKESIAKVINAHLDDECCEME